MHRASEQRDTKQAIVTELLSSGDRELDQLLPALEIAGEAEQPAADTKELHAVGADGIAGGRQASRQDGLALAEPPGIEKLQGQFRTKVPDRRQVAEPGVLVQGLAE